ncbi:tetraacyldisaccharide 4'-kinase [Polycladidibacter hongkongensis]|uniref:tetraacyldisaccharide 4'-kinase n=1 Tax=Polycladidibacter hongkongensis TaxID=1647556 RepID=UPI000AB5A7AC|nr:tetraacyldisaccharide 4'-kinase [Pseudovibrio hongkongensis]
MPIKPPEFWWQSPPSLAARALSPAGALYGALTAKRQSLAPRYQAQIPVICVGNFTVGGAGKTPTALALHELLLTQGHTPAFLLRGYGGALKGPVHVQCPHHTALDVGDEALVLARKGQTIVSADRVEGAKLAQKLGATILIMDDGFQNPSLYKDLSLVVVDAAVGIGNGLCLPAGPLRTPLSAQLPLADALVIIGEGEASKPLRSAAERLKIPALAARLAPQHSETFNKERVLAFSGIGRPQKFFESLERIGAQLEKTCSFPDHHSFTAEQATALLKEAERKDLLPVTTSKDFVRLKSSSEPSLQVLATKTEVLEVKLQLADTCALQDLIAAKTSRRQ